MTPQELKASILQLAIQGKLVEQRPEEGTGWELLRDILTQRRRGAECAEKNSHAEPRSRGERAASAASFGPACPVSPSCPVPPADAPFDIPENWVWVRLGEVASIERGSGIKRSETSQEGFPCVRYGEIYTSYGYSFKRTKSFVPESVAASCHTANQGDVLCTLTGEWKEEIAKATAYLGKEPIAIGGDLAKISSVAFNPILLVYFFFAPFMIQQKASKANGTMIVHIGKDAICNLLIPLPPLAEQKRIVAKIEELLPYINRYEKAWSKLEDFNKRFPGDMQKSLLQMAIQGKLVEQRPEEGTGEELYRQIQTEKQRLIKSGKIKKEMPLPEITPDEIPFDIPDSWKWVRLGAVLDKLVDGTHRTPKYTTSGVPFVSVRNMSSGVLSLSDTKFISEEEHSELVKRCNPQRGDILLSKVGTTGVPAKVETDEQFSLFVSVALLKFNKALLDIDFLYLTILSPSFQKQCEEHTRGVGNKNWVIVDIANTIFPLPPLAEQKRIVAKLEELLPLCERLK